MMGRFDGLIATHIPHLRRYARALTGEVTRADDLVQDTLERAWIKFHLWKPAYDLRPWLFAIMHNVFVNQVRSAARRDRTSAADDENFEQSTRANQSDLLEVSDIAACLERLPVEQREVLLLVSLEDMSYAEVGQILGIPTGTVTSRLARARARLKFLLDRGAPGPVLKVI
jgi:RNA polymerase sigma-70 factor (ECF subfamily)